jgi:transcriptional regulator with XRE-family HTH domain
MFMRAIQPQVELNFNWFNPRCLPESTASWEHGPVESRIGRLISLRLGEVGRTQRWLAEQVGVSDNAVSKWIKSGKVGKKHALKVSALLGVDLGSLLSELDVDLLPSVNTQTGQPEVIFTSDNVVAPAFDEPRRWPFSPEIHERIMQLGPEDIANLERNIASQLETIESVLARAAPAATRSSKRAS